MSTKRTLKTPGIIAAAMIGTLLLFLLLSTYGAFQTFLSWDARQTGGGWKLLGTLFLAGTGFLTWRLATDKVQPTGKNITFLVLGLILAICSNVGFKFTAGDISQRLTPFNTEGKIVNKEALYQYYDHFYHFSSDTALKNYVEQYNELPGRNTWNFYIRDGRLPKSTAPRADEDFQWHTGIYDGKLWPD